MISNRQILEACKAELMMYAERKDTGSLSLYVSNEDFGCVFSRLNEPAPNCAANEFFIFKFLEKDVLDFASGNDSLKNEMLDFLSESISKATDCSSFKKS